jgi:hypothetical protein
MLTLSNTNRPSFLRYFKDTFTDLTRSYNFILLSTASLVTAVVWYFGITSLTLGLLVAYPLTIGFIGARYYN